MSVLELRVDLHNLIDKINDSDTLNAVKTLLSGRSIAQQDWWNVISDEEKADIEEGILQAERGEYKTTDEVMEKYKEWL